nr:putative reverse transcriptase domain, aspartic peptidase domain protein [Tanacetum cinerariifolium]
IVQMVTTRNNPNDNVPNFEAMINAAVANALPNLTTALRTQITNDIRNHAGPSASHRVTIDCYARIVIFGNVRQPEFIYHGSLPLKSVKLISAMKVRTLISHGCQDTSLESPNIKNLSVVCEFADVFPDELPGLPPAREIKLGIELIPGVEPISKAPYHMAPIVQMVTTRNNPNDNVPNFEAMINVAVANALPNLTTALRTQITNDIRNHDGPSGGGGGGDAIPQ